jgi:hypothetical protein
VLHRNLFQVRVRWRELAPFVHDLLAGTVEYRWGATRLVSDDPAKDISGYKGPAKRAVWVTRAIPLD